jgi:hypothetical protein
MRIEGGTPAVRAAACDSTCPCTQGISRESDPGTVLMAVGRVTGLMFDSSRLKLSVLGIFDVMVSCDDVYKKIDITYMYGKCEGWVIYKDR